MTPALYTYAVLILAVLAANAPFLSQRWALIGPRPAHKGLGGRLVELVVSYLLVGASALSFENALGQIAPQTWEFYAVTATMFITLAFPGFVYRYLLKHQA